MEILLNRLNKKSWYGDSIEEIIKLPYQFSVFNPETKPDQFEQDDNYKATISATVDDPDYIAAREIALGLLEGRIKDNTDGATHYYNPDEANPTWIDSPKMKSLKKIGDHSFYLEG
jgi:spore germination cell wall hydrolase CwlJ-like protein